MFRRTLLFLLVLSGMLFRLAELNNPITYDEAYTWIGFAWRGWWTALSDYSLPNNHIFHTLLVVFSTTLFGDSLWAIRLPAFLAGCFLPLAVYWAGKQMYNPQTGLLAAALTAWWPLLVRYGSEARGYSLLAIFTVLTIGLAHEIVRSENRLLWLGLSLSGALGFFTLPLMLYPAGAVYLWLIVEGPKRPSFFVRWLLSGFLAGGLTLGAYAPALLVSGWRKIVANSFVQPVEIERYFGGLLLRRLADTWQSWNQGVPMPLTALLVVGLGLAFVLFWRKRSPARTFPLVLLAWVILLVITRRPEAFDRFWSWLIAPFLLWSSAGLLEAARRIRYRDFSLENVMLAIAFAGVLASGIPVLPSIPEKWAKQSNQEAAALFLVSNWQNGDVALVGYPNEPQVWYYLARQGWPESSWKPNAQATRLWLLLAANQKNETLEGILRMYQLNPAQFDLSQAEFVTKYGNIHIYQLLLRQ